MTVEFFEQLVGERVGDKFFEVSFFFDNPEFKGHPDHTKTKTREITPEEAYEKKYAERPKVSFSTKNFALKLTKELRLQFRAYAKVAIDLQLILADGVLTLEEAITVKEIIEEDRDSELVPELTPELAEAILSAIADLLPASESIPII